MMKNALSDLSYVYLQERDQHVLRIYQRYSNLCLLIERKR